MSFSVWAPTPDSVHVRVDGVDHEMTRDGDWWRSPATGGLVYASPAVSHGLVFVSSNSGRTYAFVLPD